MMIPLKLFLNCNIFDSSTKDKIKNYIKGNLDVILSDMASDTTANTSIDSITTTRPQYLRNKLENLQ